MVIRKYKSKKTNKGNKRNSKRNSKSAKLFAKHSKKTKAHRNSKTRNSKTRHSKSHNSKYKRNINNKRHSMKGGFSGCGLATVNEPGISLPDLGSIKGMSIPDTRAVIYRPSCTSSNLNQAMTP